MSSRSIAYVHEYEGVIPIEDSLYDFCSCEPGEKENVVLIFFHGMALDQLNSRVSTRDTPFKTWTFQNDNSKECWPSVMFKEDEELRKKNILVRALTVVYDASKFETNNTGRLDMYLVAECFRQSVMRHVIRKGEKKHIILVAHSFGGFVVQELIDHVFRSARNGDQRDQEVLKNLDGIFFYATPFMSLEEEVYRNLFPDNGRPYSPFVQLLTTFDQNLSRKQDQFRRNIRSIAEKYRGKPINVKAMFESNPTTVGDWTGMIAHEGTARLQGLESQVIQANHFDICKPRLLSENGLHDNKYTSLRDFIELVKSDPALGNEDSIQTLNNLSSARQRY